MTATAAAPRISAVDVLDELETLIGEARRLPFSPNVVINEELILDLVDRARLGLPQEVVEAHATLIDRERLVSDAEDEAADLVGRAEAQVAEMLATARAETERLVSEAKAAAAQLVADSTISRTAQERADALAADAETNSKRVHDEADAYARQVMEDLDGHLTRALTTVRRGLETLPKADEGSPKARRRA